MANLNLNKVVLCGRLTGDPELKQTQSGISVVSFTLAVNRRYQSHSADGQAQQQADFISCVAWRQTAEFISRYFKRGSSLCITGSIQTRNWTDQQGQKRYTTGVVVDDAMFVDSRSESQQRGVNPNNTNDDQYAPTAYSSAGAAENFDVIKSEDDLPF